MIRKVKKQIKNYYFISKEGINLLYDFENNNIISFKSKEIRDKIFNILYDYSLNKISRNDLQGNEKVLSLLDNLSLENNYFSTHKYITELKTTKIGLMLIQDCNLMCKYCYGGESGKYNSQGMNNKMTIETAQKSINYLMNNCPESENDEISFFGGEQLLNLYLIKKIINYCKKVEGKKFTYTITTNATLLTKEVIQYFEENKVSIMVSLDGYKEIHDANRVYPNGKGSFETVIQNVKELLNSNFKNYFHVRSTLTTEYLKNFENVANYFIDLGIKQIAIATESEYDDDSSEFSISTKKLMLKGTPKYKYIERLKKEILSGENPPFIPFYLILSRIHKASKNLISCGYFKGSTMVSYDGKLYPCHRFVGMKDFEFGNIFDGIDLKKLKQICSDMDTTTNKCNNCFVKYICKRGCIGDISKNGAKFIEYPEEFCDTMRKMIEDMLIFYYQLKILRPEYLLTL